jgi:hypothetical protein
VKIFRKLFLGISIAALIGAQAVAQTSPNWTFGFVPTTAQWNALWAGKQDFLGSPPLLTTGGTMTGPLVTSVPSTATAGFNLPPGVAPTTPNNGDTWTTTAGLFVQINGATVGPLASTATPSFTAPVTITGANASALAVGLNGATNPAFVVNTATALQAAGLSITGAVTGGTVAVSAIDSGSNTNLSINAKGTGTIGIGNVSTGAVTITPNVTHSGTTTLSSALTYGGVTLNNSVVGTGNMVLSVSPTFTGTITAAAANFSGTVNNTGAFQIGGTGQTFPASGLLVGTTDAQSLTNKTLASSTDVLGGVTMTLGSDANGDIYCRSGGVLTRIGAGAAATLLTSGGAGICPTWVAAPGGGNVSNTGAPTANQIAQWTNATTVQGVNLASLTLAGAGIAISGTTSPTIALSLTNATLQASPANPTGTTTTAMMGLGATCHITPVYSSRVYFEFRGHISNTAASVNGTYQARFGTGTAPANGATVTGTTVGQQIVQINPSSGVTNVLNAGGIITGLTPGTAIWLDLSLSVTGGTGSIANIACTATEF